MGNLAADKLQAYKMIGEGIAILHAQMTSVSTDPDTMFALVTAFRAHPSGSGVILGASEIVEAHQVKPKDMH